MFLYQSLIFQNLHIWDLLINYSILTSYFIWQILLPNYYYQLEYPSLFFHLNFCTFLTKGLPF